MKKYFLLSLHGQGDVEIKLVEQDVWDWINSPRPDFKKQTFINEAPLLPASVLQKFRAKHGTSKEPLEVGVTTGSWDNDRALLCPSEHSFSSLKEAMVFMKKNNIEIMDEYEGCIY